MKASRLKIIDQVSDERPIPQRWGHIGSTCASNTRILAFGGIVFLLRRT